MAAVSSRSLNSARCCVERVGAGIATTNNPEACRSGEIIIIATPDSLIRSVCEEIAGQAGFGPGDLVIHLSGAVDSGALSAAHELGADTCAMHPIQTLADPIEGARMLKSAWYCLEGDQPGIDRARCMAMALSGQVLSIDRRDKPLYHAALCMASNYLVVLEEISARMLGQAGIKPSNALTALLPLIQGAADNLQNSGLPGALTGPISRGDAATVEGHLTAIGEKCDEYTPIYRILGREALRIARDKGQMDPQGAADLNRMLQKDLE